MKGRVTGLNRWVTQRLVGRAGSMRTGEGPLLLWQLVALTILFLVFTLFATNFWSRGNWLNTSTYGSTTLILALGETLVIITSGIDLSVGAILAVASAICGIYLAAYAPTNPGGIHVLISIVLGIAVGGLMGLVNGLVITVLSISPFIATLGMLGVGEGVTLLLTGGVSVSVPGAIGPLGNSVWLGWIPVPVAIAVVLTLAVHYLLRYTRFGIHTYAIGNDFEAARRVGINATRHLTLIYSLSGLLAGIAGVLTVAEFLVASPNAGGETALLNAVAAPAIGGISLFGGRGKVIGTVIGAVIVSSTVTGLVLMGVQPFWQTVVIGIVIVLAVYVQRLGDVPFARLRWRPTEEGGEEQLDELGSGRDEIEDLTRSST